MVILIVSWMMYDSLRVLHWGSIHLLWGRQQPAWHDHVTFVPAVGDLAAAVGQIAEMALLGVGHVSLMYPETLDEVYASHGDSELQWRVQL